METATMGLGFRVILGLISIGDNIGKMENKMETTIS